MFIIKANPQGRPKMDWYVVQVVWPETVETKAKAEGIYHVRYYVRNSTDSNTRATTACRFWPEIHEYDAQGDFGKMRMVAPQKADTFLKRSGYGWYQKEVNLGTDAIIGPFDFVTIRNEHHRISLATWSNLRRQANSTEVDLLDLDRVSPLT